jgi:hypothetical protein
VGPRAGLDAEDGRKIAPAGDRTLVVQSVVRHYTDSATQAPQTNSILLELDNVDIIMYHVV